MNRQNLKKAAGILLISLSLAWVFALSLLPLNSNRRIDFKLLRQNTAPYVLVFFGYPGCHSVCPAALKSMADVYEKTEVGQLELVFVSLDTEAGAQAGVDYARAFQPGFTVYSLESGGRADMLQAFGVRYSRTEDGRIEHTGYTYLVQKQNRGWAIRRVYRQLDEETVLRDLNQHGRLG